MAVTGPMDESDFEGTVVLERLAEVGGLEDFFDAIDADDLGRARALMKTAQLDSRTIAIVLRKIAASDGEH
jgi:hypothetical protein